MYNHNGFLASELSINSPADSLFHVIPVPFEKSVSYGNGTAEGPEAILKASQQMEFFDGSSCPGESGIYTHPAISADSPETMISTAGRIVESVVTRNKIPVLLGGEHTVTLAAVEGLRGCKNFGVVQFDAHADLRNSYEGSSFSHACVMRRIAEQNIPIFQIGVRSLSLAEVAFRQEQDIARIDMTDIHRHGIPDPILPRDFPENIYINIDVDGLDPSIMPATGTPEPGGLFWQQLMSIFESIAATRRIIGFDAVELAPIAGIHFPQYTTARMIYNLMGFITRREPVVG